MAVKTAYLKITLSENKYEIQAFHYPTWWHELNKNTVFRRDNFVYVVCVIADREPWDGQIKGLVKGYHERALERGVKT